MRQRLPLAISVAALAVALLGTSAPAIAHGVKHALFAHNADKVDGLHAAKKAKPGRLLALRADGQFAPAAIPGPFARTVTKNLETFAGCEQKDVIVEPVTVKRPSALYVSGEVSHWTQSASVKGINLRIELRQDGATVAQTWSALASAPSGATGTILRNMVSGVLETFLGSNTPYVAQPATYSIVLVASPTNGACNTDATVMDRISLTYFLVRPSP